MTTQTRMLILTWYPRTNTTVVIIITLQNLPAYLSIKSTTSKTWTFKLSNRFHLKRPRLHVQNPKLSIHYTLRTGWIKSFFQSVLLVIVLPTQRLAALSPKTYRMHILQQLLKTTFMNRTINVHEQYECICP